MYMYPVLTLPPLTGNWTQALRKVVESVYTYFSYDVTTYIAGNLEICEEEDEEEEETKTVDIEEEENKENGEKGEEKEREKEEDMSQGDENIERDGGVGEEDEDGEETDDAFSGPEYETSTEEDAFEESKSPVRKLENGSPGFPAAARTVKNEKNVFQYHLSGRHHSHSSSSGEMQNNHTLHTETHSRSKTVSSFTVENILMGNTSRSNSSSSGSPNSAPHISTTSFLPFTPHSGSGSTSTPVSPASNNWTSHPPVKYTKFTMMSPLSMRSGGDKRKKGERDKTMSTSAFDANHRLQLPSTSEPTHKKDVPEAPKCKDEPLSPAPASVAVRMPASCTASSHPNLTYHHSVIQTAIPTISFSRQSSAQSVNAVSPRIGPVSPSTITSFPPTQTQSPHQQQQYVVFFPPNLLMTAPTSELQVIGPTSSSQLYVQSTVPRTANNHNPKDHKHTSLHPPLSPSSPHNSISTTASSSNNHCIRLPPTTSIPHTSSTLKMMDPRYHPIAPRAENSAPTYTTVRVIESDQGLHKVGTKPLLSKDKNETKKTAPKQKKLRFHMTTVVKKVKRRSSSVSLTAPPPTLCDRQPPDVKHKDTRVSENSVNHDGTTDKSNSESLSQSNRTTDTLSSTSPPFRVISARSSDSLDLALPQPLPSDSQTSLSNLKLSTAGDSATSHTTEQNDSVLHQQLANQSQNQSSLPLLPTSIGSTPVTQPPLRGRGRGKRARGYKRRKRELTFHLYEDPATAFRAKRTRQHN